MRRTGAWRSGWPSTCAISLLFVAGGFTGGAYVYDTRTGATVASYQFTDQPSLINDVAIGKDGAWFTDSAHPVLYFVPIGRRGALGSFRTVTLSGPAGDASGEVNNNGIQATPDGKALIVAHSAQAALNLVDPATGASSTIADVSLPGVDGLLLEGHRLYAVQNFLNQIAEVRLGAHYRSGVVRKVITSALFQVPATVARFGDRLAAANAKFDTGFPPTADQYEVVVVTDNGTAATAAGFTDPTATTAWVRLIPFVGAPEVVANVDQSADGAPTDVDERPPGS